MAFLKFGLSNEQIAVTEEIGNARSIVDDPARKVNFDSFSAGSKCL